MRRLLSERRNREHSETVRGSTRRAWLAGLLALVLIGMALAACTGDRREDGSSSRSKAAVAATIARGVADQLALGPEIGADYSGLRAVLVTVDGRTVFEKYYNASPDDTFNTFSVTKSVLSTLVGIAFGEGKLDLDDTLSQLLPKYASSMAPPTSGATLRQLLSMTAGFNARSGPAFWTSADWVEDILTSAEVAAPGDSFVYSDESAHLVSAILEGATGESALQYARARLFGPLGISTVPAFTPTFGNGNVAGYLRAGFAWPVDPQGHATGHSWLKLRPADLAKIGQLYLDRGTYGGRQVVPSAWVREATTNQSEAPVTGSGGDGYGFMWWVRSADDDPAYAALGSGGQMIEVVPNLRLVVVTAVDIDYGDATDHGVDESLTLSLAESVIAPAVRGKS
jgi:CubicO group peptidase (beta-lactamase class C family)